MKYLYHTPATIFQQPLPQRDETSSRFQNFWCNWTSLCCLSDWCFLLFLSFGIFVCVRVCVWLYFLWCLCDCLPACTFLCVCISQALTRTKSSCQQCCVKPLLCLCVCACVFRYALLSGPSFPHHFHIFLFYLFSPSLCLMMLRPALPICLSFSLISEETCLEEARQEHKGRQGKREELTRVLQLSWHPPKLGIDSS